MSCKICGRNNCCASFHSIEELREYDEIAEPIKNRILNNANYAFQRLSTYTVENDDDIYVKYSDVEDLINDIVD